MKQSIVLADFKGIAPRYGDLIKVGMAETAVDCDLWRGKLGPRNSDDLVSANTNSHNSIFKFGETWLSGNDSYYLEWRIGTTDILIYLDNGTLKRRIGAVTVDLGQNPPGKPSASNITQRFYLSDTATYEWRASGTNNEAYCVLVGGGNPSLPYDGGAVLYVNGEVKTKGAVGTLDYNQWGYGNNDSLGFSTIYIKFSYPAGAGGQWYWAASAVAGEYYLAATSGPMPTVPSAPRYVSEVVDGGTLFTAGTLGSLGSNEYAVGDNDALGANAIYIRTDGSDPNGVIESLFAMDIVNNMWWWTEFGSPASDDTVTTTSSIIYTVHEGSLVGNYRYVTTLTRNVGGYTDESGPSEVSDEISIAEGMGSKIQIIKPTISDPYVTHWNIYRLSDNTAEYLFVAQATAATPSYVDNTVDADLSTAISTWYTSNQGNEVTFAKPLSGMEGIATDLHAGMIFTWKGSTLYFCEPGIPDAWPAHYTINFRSPIKRVLPFAGSVAVLCETGPFRVDGTQPEQLQPSKALGNEPCISTVACVTNKGVVYLSDSGLVLFNLVDSTVFSLGAFNELWFNDNVAPDGAVIVASHDVLYLFHSAGTLCYNATTSQWTQLSLVAIAAWVNPEDGDAYYLLEGTGIYHLMNNDSVPVDFTWGSGQLLGKDPEADKRWTRLRAKGTGTVTIAAAVDGDTVATKAVNMDSVLDRDGRLNLPVSAVGRSMKLTFSGTGTVEQAIVEYEL